jgi:uroporphyrinogen-III decarboxylase
MTHPDSPSEQLLRTLRHAPAPLPFDGDGSWVFADHPGRFPPEDGVDEWGVTWRPLPASYVPGAGEPLRSYPARPAAGSLAELAERPTPEPPEAVAFVAAVAAARLESPGAVVIGRHPVGPFDRLQALLGPERALLALARERVASRAALDRIAAHHVTVSERYLAAGAEIGWLADEVAGSGGPLFGPALWRETVLPGLAGIIGVYKASGAPVVYHTCGEASAFIGDLLDAGADFFNLQSEACDLAELKRRYGRRIGFFGGLPVEVMLEGTPEEVRRAAAMAVRTLGNGGGLVLAPDQSMAYPEGNAVAFRQAAWELLNHV